MSTLGVPVEMWLVVLAPPAWLVFVTAPMCWASRNYRMVRRVPEPVARRPQPPAPAAASADQPIRAEAA